MSTPGEGPGRGSAAGEEPGRVAVFAAHYPPHVGGVERYTESLWSRMAGRGWEVLVVTADTGGGAPAAGPTGMRVAVLPAPKVVEGGVPVPRPSRDAAALWRGLCAAPPDVVVSNTRYFPTSWLAAALALRTRRPLLHIEHGSAPVRLGRPAVDALTGAVDRVAGGWVLRRAARCAGVSTAVADYLRAERGVREPCVLPNGVEAHGWERASTDYRARLGLAPTNLLVVHAGRLVAAKGVRDTLAAFGLLRGAARERLRLAMAGDGPLAAEVSRQAAADARVTALGRLSRTSMHDLFVAADVVVHPSTYPEGLPSVLLEAAAAGATIIASPAGGTTDLVRHGETGLLVPAGDPRRLAEALELLASDDALRERLAAAARLLVRELFDWDLVADALEGQLDALVAERPSVLPVTAPVGFD